MRPLIGITPHLEGEDEALYVLSCDYVKAVELAGGIPVILPFVSGEDSASRLLESIHGLVFAGGVDVDPVYFNEEPVPKLGTVCPERDRFEITLARLALDRDVPALGICRGIQLLNVAAGGSLYQDIPSQIKGALKHYQDAPRWAPSHAVHLKAGSRIAHILKATELRVNSFHHQSVKAVAKGFQVTGAAEDGVIEAIESPDRRYAVGVQWHAENMVQRYPAFLELFKALVDAAAAAMR